MHTLIPFLAVAALAGAAIGSLITVTFYRAAFRVMRAKVKEVEIFAGDPLGEVERIQDEAEQRIEAIRLEAEQIVEAAKQRWVVARDFEYLTSRQAQPAENIWPDFVEAAEKV